MEAKIKGTTVRISPKFPLPAGYERTGTVIAESDMAVGVKFEGHDIPVVIRKAYVGVIARPIENSGQ